MEREKEDCAHYTIDDALDAIGFGPFHWLLLALSGIGFAASSMELLLPSLLFPHLMAEWNVSATMTSTLMMGTFAGEVVGGFVWGWMSDRMGRRPVYVGTALLAAVCAISTSFARNISDMLVLRSALGFALGGSMSIDFVYFVEFVPAKHRGSRSTLIILVGIFGLFLVGVLGKFILPVYGWRVFLAACGAPMALLAVLRTALPWETPRFLLGKGRLQESENILKIMSFWNRRPLPGASLLPLAGGPLNPAKQSVLSSLRSSNLLPLTLAFGSVFMLHTFAYYGMTTWFALFAAVHKISRVELAIGWMLIAVAEVPGLFLSCWLIDRMGRRIVLSGNLMGAALLVSMMAMVPPGDALTFKLLSCGVYFFIVGVWAGLYVYGPEAFPTSIRSSAFALCGTMGKLGGLVSPIVLGVILDRGSIATARNAIALAFFAASIICAIGLKETRGDRLKDTL